MEQCKLVLGAILVLVIEHIVAQLLSDLGTA